MVVNYYEFSIIQGMDVHDKIRKKLLGELMSKNVELDSNSVSIDDQP